MRTLKAAGVDHVKVEPTLTDEQLRAVIEEFQLVVNWPALLKN